MHKNKLCFQFHWKKLFLDGVDLALQQQQHKIVIVFIPPEVHAYTQVCDHTWTDWVARSIARILCHCLDIHLPNEDCVREALRHLLGMFNYFHHTFLFLQWLICILRRYFMSLKFIGICTNSLSSLSPHEILIFENHKQYISHRAKDKYHKYIAVHTVAHVNHGAFVRFTRYSQLDLYIDNNHHLNNECWFWRSTFRIDALQFELSFYLITKKETYREIAQRVFFISSILVIQDKIVVDFDKPLVITCRFD